MRKSAGLDLLVLSVPGLSRLVAPELHPPGLEPILLCYVVVFGVYAVVYSRKEELAPTRWKARRAARAIGRVAAGTVIAMIAYLVTLHLTVGENRYDGDPPRFLAPMRYQEDQPGILQYAYCLKVGTAEEATAGCPAGVRLVVTPQLSEVEARREQYGADVVGIPRDVWWYVWSVLLGLWYCAIVAGLAALYAIARVRGMTARNLAEYFGAEPGTNPVDAPSP